MNLTVVLGYVEVDCPGPQLVGHRLVGRVEFFVRVTFFYQRTSLERCSREGTDTYEPGLPGSPAIPAFRLLPEGSACPSNCACQPNRFPLLRRVAGHDPQRSSRLHEMCAAIFVVLAFASSRHLATPNSAESIRMTPYFRTPCFSKIPAMRHAIFTALRNFPRRLDHPSRNHRRSPAKPEPRANRR